MELVVHGLRNGHLETLHPCSAVVIDAAVGKTVFSAGPDLATFWRSASKPFQLLTSLAHLDGSTVDSLDDCDLALGAASHSGQASHVLRVRALLERFGLKESQLQCGASAPMHEPTARTHSQYQIAMNNCSGKHTFMLAASQQQGWPLDYRDPGHPLQVANHAAVDSFAGNAHRVGIDGCSIPTFHGSLSGQARAWSHIAVAMVAGPTSKGPDSTARLGRIGWAMHQHPFFMSGNGRLDLAVVTRASEPLTVKIGAEGLFCIARPGASQGIAVKVHSGLSEALGPAVRAVMERLGVTFSGRLPGESVRNVRGVVVGERKVSWG